MSWFRTTPFSRKSKIHSMCLRIAGRSLTATPVDGQSSLLSPTLKLALPFKAGFRPTLIPSRLQVADPVQVPIEARLRPVPLEAKLGQVPPQPKLG